MSSPEGSHLLPFVLILVLKHHKFYGALICPHTQGARGSVSAELLEASNLRTLTGPLGCSLSASQNYILQGVAEVLGVSFLKKCA